MTREAAPAEAVDRARHAAARHLSVRPEAISLELLDLRRSVRPIFLARAGDRELVVKQYVDGAFLDGAARRLAAVAAIDDRIEVPRLLAVETTDLLLLMSVVHGVPLLRRLEGSREEAATASERAGAAIAILHGSPIAFPDRKGRRAALDGSARMVAKYGRAAREHAAGAGDLARSSTVEDDAARAREGFRLAERLLAGLPEGRLVPTHGDLGPGQLIDCGRRLAILDFDRAVTAERALDLGLYLAKLTRELPGGAAEHAEQAGHFLAGYASEGDLPPRPAIDAYTLVILLRKLARATRPPSLTAAWEAATADARAATAGPLRAAIDRILETGSLS
jgi:aminoglycoside phosphotransferase (APT) family kinase protein